MFASAVFAMAAPPDGASRWLQFVPFILVTRNLLLHHPDAHAAEAEEGAGVSAVAQGRGPGHHHGRHLRPESRSSATRAIQLQIADKVRIDSREGVHRRLSGPGARGEPSKPLSGHEIGHMSNLRWKLLTTIAVTIIFGAVGVYPIVAARYGITQPEWLLTDRSEARARPQGWRPPRAARADRRCAADRERNRDGAAPRAAVDCRDRRHEPRTGRHPTSSRSRDRAGSGRGVPQRPPTRSAPTSIATRASTAPTPSR